MTEEQIVKIALSATDSYIKTHKESFKTMDYDTYLETYIFLYKKAIKKINSKEETVKHQL